jgi:hypothetical protein
MTKAEKIADWQKKDKERDELGYHEPYTPVGLKLYSKYKPSDLETFIISHLIGLVEYNNLWFKITVQTMKDISVARGNVSHTTVLNSIVKLIDKGLIIKNRFVKSSKSDNYLFALDPYCILKVEDCFETGSALKQEARLKKEWDILVESRNKEVK